MKILLSMLFLSILLCSCAKTRIHAPAGIAIAQMVEQDNIIEAIKGQMAAFNVLELLGAPDKIYLTSSDRSINSYWFYENKYPFSYSFVIYLEDGISKNFTRVTSISIQITGEVD